MGWAMCKTKDGEPVESEQGRCLYTQLCFAQLLDYYGMLRKVGFTNMDRVVRL
jgi:hypothetical protein